MPGSPHIRPARPGEAAALTALSLRSKAHWGYDQAFMEACRQELSLQPADITRRAAIYVREAGGHLVGFYGLSELGAGRLELDPLFVEPHAIGQGHGGALMRHALVRARELGASEIEVHSDPQAAPFYAALGAIPVGERPSDSIPGRVLPVLVFRVEA